MPDRPSAPAMAPMRFTQEDIRTQIDQLARNKGRVARLLRLSSNLWRRDSPEDLLQEALRRLLKANPATIDADIPFDITVALFMRRQAADWGRKAEPRSLVTGLDAKALESATAPVSGRKPARSSSDEGTSERQGFAALAGWSQLQPRTTPEDDCHAHQVLTLLFERIGDDVQLRDYMIARYVDGLQGEELRKALGLTPIQFANLTRRAHRMLSTVKDELSR